MSKSDLGNVWDGEMLSAPIPRGRDPFVNVPLMPAGRDAAGRERFWISSYNAHFGSTGVLINDIGEYKIFKFDDPKIFGLYSAVYAGNDVMWGCGFLDKVVKIDLAEGGYKSIPTGVRNALVFEGMPYDPATGKIFALAYPPPHTVAFSFDTNTRETVRVYEDPTHSHYMRFSFPNGDGTYSIVTHCTGETILCWDPVAETLEVVKQTEGEHDTLRRDLVSDADGRYYFPEWGWYNPATRAFDMSGPTPDEECTWAHRYGAKVYGYQRNGGDTAILEWDLEGNGKVRKVLILPDQPGLGWNITEDGKLVAVNMYGVFFRFDLETGSLECSKRLPAENIQNIDYLGRMDDERIVGTPFITQRFWTVNMRTGEGEDCGRVAPGGGEIMQGAKVGDMIYLAAYAGGELMEFDPALPARYPENPRVVAAPKGAMRPVAIADDGRRLYYASSRHYGNLGSVLCGYDTDTGIATNVMNVMGNLQIRSLVIDESRNRLICGSSIEADCSSCPAEAKSAAIGVVDADTLELQKQVTMPEGTWQVLVHGTMPGDRCLVQCVGRAGNEDPHQRYFYTMDLAALEMAAPDTWVECPKEWRRMVWTGIPGLYVVHEGDIIKVLDLSIAGFPVVRVLHQEDGMHHFFVQGEDVMFSTATEVRLLNACLAGLTLSRPRRGGSR